MGKQDKQPKGSQHSQSAKAHRQCNCGGLIETLMVLPYQDYCGERADGHRYTGIQRTREICRGCFRVTIHIHYDFSQAKWEGKYGDQSERDGA